VVDAQKYYNLGFRSRQLCSSAPSKRIRAENFMAPDPANFLISSLKKNPAENYMAPDPANFLISSLKKNPAKNYMAPDPANYLHQLPQKESGGKLYGSRSRQLSSLAPSKRCWIDVFPPLRVIL